MLYKIFVNAVSNYVRFFFDIVIYFFLTPFIISSLGEHDFGILTLISSLLGAIGLLNMGIGTGVVKYIAESASFAVQETNRIASTFLGIYLLLSLIALAVMLVGSYLLTDFFSIPAESHTIFLQVFWIMGCRMIILYLPLHLFYGVLFGRQKIVLINATKLFSETLYAALCWFLLFSGGRLLALSFLSLGQMLVEHAFYILVCYRTIPGFKISKKSFDMDFLRTALPFSIHAFIINVSNFILLKSDPIIVKMFFSFSQVGVYGVALKLSESSLLIFKQFINVLTPVAAEMYGVGNMAGVKRVFMMGARYAIMPAMLLWVGFLVHGEFFLVWWLGDTFREAAPILYILSGSVVLIMPQLSAANALAMSGHHKVVSHASLLAVFTNIFASLLLLYFFGFLGVAIGSLVAVILIDIGFILRKALQVFSVSVSEFSRSVFLPVLVAGILEYILLVMSSKIFLITNFWQMIVFSLPAAFAFVGVLFLFLTTEEKMVIKRVCWRYVYKC